jgi:hypothetical protein
MEVKPASVDKHQPVRHENQGRGFIVVAGHGGTVEPLPPQSTIPDEQISLDSPGAGFARSACGPPSPSQGLAGDHPTTEDPRGYGLRPEEVREFQEIVREETGETLTSGEAWNRAIELIALVRMLVAPYPEDREG